MQLYLKVNLHTTRENQDHFIGTTLFWTQTMITQVLLQFHFRGLPLNHVDYFQKSNPTNFGIFTLNVQSNFLQVQSNFLQLQRQTSVLSTHTSHTTTSFFIIINCLYYFQSSDFNGGGVPIGREQE